MATMHSNLTRRAALRLLAMAAGSAAVAACSAPLPTPTPLPTAVATVSPQKVSQDLIGRLEGPTLVLEPSKFPRTFAEAPALAAQVRAGKLPPLEKRLPVPEHLLVIRPVNEVGKYGGTWRRGFTGAFDTPNGQRTAALDHILFYDFTVTRLVPGLARSWEVSDDGRATTVYLRKGLRWSDGQPLTAADFQFWWEDIYLNPDLTSVPNVNLTINGKPGTFEKVDDYTIRYRYRFPDPYFMFPEFLAGFAGITSHAVQGGGGGGGFAPAHYLKQFHPKYASAAALEARRTAARAATTSC